MFGGLEIWGSSRMPARLVSSHFTVQLADLSQVYDLLDSEEVFYTAWKECRKARNCAWKLLSMLLV